MFRLGSWCEYDIDMNIPGEAGTGMLKILNIFQLKIDSICLALPLFFGLHGANPGTQLVYFYNLDVFMFFTRNI